MKHRLIQFYSLLLVQLPLCMATDDKAVELVQRVEDLYRSTASRATMTMRVKTPYYERSMTMESYTIGRDKMLIRILTPRKERGIATLKLDKEMWNFFPKINKTIKIPPSMMMGSWMGSDFTNDDLVKETSLTKHYSLNLKEELKIYEIILTPREQTVTVWDKIVVKINKKNLTPIEQAFFDKKGRKIRVMTYREPKQFGDVILPSIIEILPLNKKGRKTIVVYEKLELNAQDVEDDLFTLRSLKRRLR